MALIPHGVNNSGKVMQNNLMQARMRAGDMWSAVDMSALGSRCMSTSCCLSPFRSSRVPNACAVPSGIWASELNVHSVIVQLYQDSLTFLLLPEDLNQSSFLFNMIFIA